MSSSRHLRTIIACSSNNAFNPRVARAAARARALDTALAPGNLPTRTPDPHPPSYTTSHNSQSARRFTIAEPLATGNVEPPAIERTVAIGQTTSRTTAEATWSCLKSPPPLFRQRFGPHVVGFQIKDNTHTHCRSYRWPSK